MVTNPLTVIIDQTHGSRVQLDSPAEGLTP
jgi:hypothetical protein